jgi:DNA-binding transcriptional LysR family regulator
VIFWWRMERGGMSSPRCNTPLRWLGQLTMQAQELFKYEGELSIRILTASRSCAGTQSSRCKLGLTVLDLPRLAVLREVARRGSLSAAALELAYTPSAVSQQIAALEREVGLAVLERRPRGVVLTDAGRHLLAHAEEILGRVEAAEEEMQALAGLRSGSLRLGAFSSAGAVLVPRAVIELQRRYPGVHLTLEEMEPDEAVAQLRDREIDLALVYELPTSHGSEPPALEYEHLLDDPLYIGLPKNHRLAARKRIRVTELAAERWVRGVYQGSTLSVLSTACQAAGFEPNVVFRCDDHLAVQGFVAAGLGIAVMPGLTRATMRKDIVTCTLVSDGRILTRDIGLARSRAYSPPPAAALTEILRDVVDTLDQEQR